MPETIGFLLLSAAGVTEIAGFTVTASTAAIIGNVALATAAIGANLALNALNQPAGDKPQDGQLTVRQALPIRRRSYGLVKISGPIMFSETLNGRRYQVIAINQGEIDAYLHHWLDDAEAVLDTDGTVIGRYDDGPQRFVVIDFERGTDSDPADGILLGIFPSIWTTAHQGKGIAKVMILTAQPVQDKFTKIFPGGQPPVYRAIAQTAKVWHPGLAQDRNDKSTWTYTANPVLIALDFHRHADGMGLAAYDDVFVTDAAIAEDWLPATAICDELIAQKDGSFLPRYQCCGGYDLNSPPKDTLASILSTCDGQTFQRSDGAIGIRVGKTIAPTVTISDQHIIGYEGLRNGPPNSLIPVNQVTAKYTDIKLDFQEADADNLEDTAAIAIAGRLETRDLKLQWVPYHSQTRRLMKLAFNRFNPEWSGQVITDMDGMRAWSERYIHLVISELGIDDTFEMTADPQFMPASMTVMLTVATLHQSAFDWDVSEEGTAPTIPDSGPAGDIIADPTGVATSVAAHAISITWDDPTRIDEIAEAQYSLHGAGNWFNASVNGSNNGAVTPALAAATYDIQVRFIVGSNVSNWVPKLSIVVT